MNVMGVQILVSGLLFLFFSAIGIVLIIISLRRRQHAQESQRWLTTDGLITLREAAVSQTSDTSGNASASYYPRVEYEYTVMGTQYHGTRIAFGAVKNYPQQADVQAVLARYPEGATVAVHYNPNQPEDAVLEQSAPAANLALVIGVIFLVVALCSAVGGIGALLISAIGGN